MMAAESKSEPTHPSLFEKKEKHAFKRAGSASVPLHDKLAGHVGPFNRKSGPLGRAGHCRVAIALGAGEVVTRSSCQSSLRLYASSLEPSDKHTMNLSPRLLPT